MWTRTVLILPALLTTGCASLLNPALDPYGGYSRPMLRPYAMRAPMMAPLPVGRWDNVMRLPLDSTIDIVTVDGVPHVGLIGGADAQAVVLREGGQETRIARASIVRIDLVDVAGSETAAVAGGAVKGAMLGVGAAALIGAVFGGPAWPPRGPFLRGAIAIGGVAGGAAVLEQRRQRMIYLAPSAAGGRSRYGGYGPYPGYGAYDPYQDEQYSQDDMSGRGPRYPGAFDLPACAAAPAVGGGSRVGLPNEVQSPAFRRVNVATRARVSGSAIRSPRY